MGAFQKVQHLSTKGNCDVIDITVFVTNAVAESGVKTGIVNVSGRGSTLAITSIEYEAGCVLDLTRALDKIAPPSSAYAHNERWGDNNGYSHIRSALLGTAKSYPVIDGRVGLGMWQQIVLCDLDDRPREREITVTVVGE